LKGKEERRRKWRMARGEMEKKMDSKEVNVSPKEHF